MGTCGDDYTTTTKVGYLTTGAATDGTSSPTTTEACNAIQVAQDAIDGYLHRTAAYTSVPLTITDIATRVTLRVLQTMRAWQNAEGATSDSDFQGTATYPPDLFDDILTDKMKKELDAWKANEDWVLSGEVTLIIDAPQDSDLDFSKDEYQ